MPFALTPFNKPSARRKRNGGSVPWPGTLACGVVQIMIAAAAIALPLLEGRPIAALVGWLLVAGGATEFALGWTARRSSLGKALFGSGLLTFVMGALFVASGWTGAFPLTTLLILWLCVRGLIALEVGYQAPRAAVNWFWLEVRGLIDVGLGLLLLLGVPIAMLPILLFGVPRDLITVFGISLAMSFLAAGAGLVAIAITQLRHDAAFLSKVRN